MIIEAQILSVNSLKEGSYTIKSLSQKITYHKLKDCLEFVEIKGFWPLSKANYNDLVTLFGDAWIGHRVELYKSEMEIDEKSVPCLKIRVPVRSFLK